nr:hypothetical protein [Saprospiraceae bacterium]
MWLLVDKFIPLGYSLFCGLSASLLIVSLSVLPITYTSAQINHNFFGDEFLTHRENHHWIKSNQIKELHLLKKDPVSEIASVVWIEFDHNGLPVKKYTGDVSNSWKPGDELNFHTLEDYLYIMRDLFLRQEVTEINLKENEKRDTVNQRISYINFFNRDQYVTPDGILLQYQFVSGNRLTQIKAESDTNSHYFEVSYEDKVPNKITEKYREKMGPAEILRTALYHYDENMLPTEITILEGESTVRLKMKYDERTIPLSKTIFKNGIKTGENVYFFTFDGP